MVRHRVLQRTILQLQLENAPAVINFESYPNVPRNPLHRQPHERSRSIDHQFGQVSRRQNIRRLVSRTDGICHFQQAQAAVASDDESAFCSCIFSHNDMCPSNVTHVRYRVV
jgi:hypothetical protein